ncbi:hypothetical protein [Tunturibacter empetritectus]|uniref:Uncharacterized protein n=1 Tax=Tunturiibacter lichenicola TaxID=2051959 RepID=A0A7W8J6Y6_9BACT|nr:hypothetical protein [Edaphobacter lichenicola]MBB5343792.1 hypothetical protein [Edaphobacter lichenicola]
MAIQKKSLISNLESTKKSAPATKSAKSDVSVSNAPVASRVMLAKKAAGGVSLSKQAHLSKQVSLSKQAHLSKQVSLSKQATLSKQISLSKRAVEL